MIKRELYKLLLEIQSEFIEVDFMAKMYTRDKSDSDSFKYFLKIPAGVAFYSDIANKFCLSLQSCFLKVKLSEYLNDKLNYAVLSSNISSVLVEEYVKRYNMLSILQKQKVDESNTLLQL